MGNKLFSPFIDNFQSQISNVVLCKAPTANYFHYLLVKSNMEISCSKSNWLSPSPQLGHS